MSSNNVTLRFDKYRITFEGRHPLQPGCEAPVAELVLWQQAEEVLDDKSAASYAFINFYNTDYFLSDSSLIPSDRLHGSGNVMWLALPTSVLNSVMESLRHSSEIRVEWNAMMKTMSLQMGGFPRVKGS